MKDNPYTPLSIAFMYKLYINTSSPVHMFTNVILIPKYVELQKV